jgi:predicted ATPase/class 3 adenylate cyclase
MAELPTGTVTFLFTDIEGSTRLLQELGRDRYRDVEEEHGRLLRTAFEHEGGHVVRIEGDAFFVVFPTPTGAVRGAVAAQRAVASHRFRHGEPIRVRIGMHTGEAHLGGGDYVGIDVNRAARIAAAGHGGQVLLSGATRALVEHDLPEGIRLRDLGSHRLKDIAHPERIHDLLIEGLPSEFPPLKTMEVPVRLPVQVTSFVGRDRELRAVTELVRSESLVTLTGPGGTGKTRLALRVAEEVLPEFGGGAFFVDLSPLTEPMLVPSTIAQALRLKEDPGRSLVEVVTGFLADREALLILDNFEQVVEAAPMVDELVVAGGGSTVLVTTRVRLGLAGEHEYGVPPLDPPDPGVRDPETLSRSEAVALFVDRARAVRHDFALTDENAPAVAEICAKVDGLPLALELAAGQVRLLTPREIGARLDSRLGALGVGPRNLPDRQRTLRRTIEWSYDLLGPVERTLFARLAVFTSGATLEAVEAVCNPGRDLGADTLDALATLVDHSLVRRVESPEGSRFDMLESIREFALEQLEEAGQVSELRDRHAVYYVELGELAEPHLNANRDVWLDRMERDHQNLQAATEWALEADRGELGMRNVAALWRLFLIRGHVGAGRQVVSALLALPSAAAPTRARARALLALGGLAYWQDDMPAARRAYEAGLALARRLGNRALVADALFDLAYIEGVEGRFDVGHALLQEAGDIRDELGDRHGRAWVDVARAQILGLQGRWDEGLVVLEGALAPMEEAGDGFGVENVVGGIAAAEFRRGNLDRAEELLRRNILNSAHWASKTMGIAAMASLALARGDATKAVRLWGAFEAIVEERQSSAPRVLLPLGDTRDEARSLLGDDRAAQADREGRAMGPDEAWRYAVGEVER